MSYPKQQYFSNNQPVEAIVRSPLLQAIDQNRVDLCEELILNDKEVVNERGWNDLTPLHQVCLRGQVLTLRLLLKHGAAINAKSAFGETPLHYACRRGDVIVIHILIKAGSDVLTLDQQGRSCIHFAALGGSIPAVHYLFTLTEAQLDLQDDHGETALHIGCTHRHFLLLDYLLRNKRLDPTIQNKDGMTVLHLATQMGNLLVVWKLLCAAHCGIIAIENHQGNNAIDVAKNGITPQHQEVAKTLEFYNKQPQDSPPKPPLAAWWFLLLLPFSWATFVCLIVTYSNSYSGYVSLIMFAILVWFVSRQQHRMQHPLRWPNPVFVGAFVGGILQCTITAYYRFILDLWPCYYLAFTVLVLTGSCCFYLSRLLRGDPGLVRQSRCSNGKPLTILDVATGKCKENEFCVFTEMIRPENTKYCKLCERLVMDLDHHCLFIGNCVARRNHRDFVLFIANVMILQVSFVWMTLLYMRNFYPNSEVESAVSLMFHYEPYLLDLVLLCLLSFVWEGTLIFDQLRNIAKGQTSYFSNFTVYKDMTEICTACQNHQAEEIVVKCLSQKSNKHDFGNVD